MDALLFSQKKEFSEIDRLILDIISAKVDFEYLPEIEGFEEIEKEENVYEIVSEDENKDENELEDEDNDDDNDKTELIDSLVNKYWNEHTIWNIFI